MLDILSVDNMRASDAATISAGTMGTTLMRRAGEGIYNEVARGRGWIGNIGIVCGTGNNAGDGYVLALILNEVNIKSCLLILKDKFSVDGKYYYEKCVEAGIEVRFLTQEVFDFKDYDIIVDCIYGTGFHGSVRQPDCYVIDAINAARDNSYVVSVDINSGLNGKNGLAEKCVISDLTISIGSYQPGHFLNMAKDVMKEKVNCPIGIEPIEEPYYLFEEIDAKKLFPIRENHANKGTYGYVALIGGSLMYSGAIRLAYIANASMRSGAGVTTVAVPRSISEIVASHILESTLYPLNDIDGFVSFDEELTSKLIKHRKAIAFGMGIGRSVQSAQMLKYILENYDGILIIDADGISDLADIGCDILLTSKAKIVLTPHFKEFSRINGKSVEEIMASPIEESMEFAKKYNVTILLKGPTTIITNGSRVYLVSRGCAGMATAGSGDVLSGILAAVCTCNEERLLEAVAAAAYINGRAGELASDKYGSVSMLAGDTAMCVAEVIKSLANDIQGYK